LYHDLLGCAVIETPLLNLLLTIPAGWKQSAHLARYSRAPADVGIRRDCAVNSSSQRWLIV